MAELSLHKLLQHPPLICICPFAVDSNSQAEHNLTVNFALTRQLSAAGRHRAQVRLPEGARSSVPASAQPHKVTSEKLDATWKRQTLPGPLVVSLERRSGCQS